MPSSASNHTGGGRGQGHRKSTKPTGMNGGVLVPPGSRCSSSFRNSASVAEGVERTHLMILTFLPLWLAAALLVGVLTLLAMGGPALIRRRLSLERLRANNEVAGFKFATVGVLYAVLLAFAVIVLLEMRRAPGSPLFPYTALFR